MGEGQAQDGGTNGKGLSHVGLESLTHPDLAGTELKKFHWTGWGFTLRRPPAWSHLV